MCGSGGRLHPNGSIVIGSDGDGSGVGGGRVMTNKDIALKLGYRYSEEGFEERGLDGEVWARSHWRNPRGLLIIAAHVTDSECPDFLHSVDDALECWKALPDAGDWELHLLDNKSWYFFRGWKSYVHRDVAQVICAAFMEDG